jgi:hypothetical protein
MSTWNRRRAILAGIAAMFTPAAVAKEPAVSRAVFYAGNVLMALDCDGYTRGGTPLLGALNSKFKFGVFRPDTAI